MQVLCKNPECKKFSEINEFAEDRVSCCSYCGHRYESYGVNLEALAECKRLSDGYYDKWMWPSFILMLLMFVILPSIFIDGRLIFVFLFGIAIIAEFVILYGLITPRLRKKFSQYHDQENN